MDDLKDEFPHLPERIADLGKLAYNLWWSWHPAARMLFKRLDRLAWKATGHNSVKLFQGLCNAPFLLTGRSRGFE